MRGIERAWRERGITKQNKREKESARGLVVRRMSPFASATEEFESGRRMKEIGELLRYFISRRKVNFKYDYYG